MTASRLTATTAMACGHGSRTAAGYYTETGLVLCTHRFYDPSAGRWLTRDPIGYDGGINLYGYTENNPINEDDADGTDYLGDVGQVFAGYGDVLNPVNWAKGVAQTSQIAGADGFAVAGSALAGGVYHGLTDWTTTNDPRRFGQSFGTTLLTVAPGLKAIPSPIPIRLLGLFGDSDGITLLRVDNVNRLGADGVNAPQMCRLDFGRPPSRGKGATTIPPNWRGKFFLHCHRRGPGGIARHRPWQGGNGTRW